MCVKKQKYLKTDVFFFNMEVRKAYLLKKSGAELHIQQKLNYEFLFSLQNSKYTKMLINYFRKT